MSKLNYKAPTPQVKYKEYTIEVNFLNEIQMMKSLDLHTNNGVHTFIFFFFLNTEFYTNQADSVPKSNK